ncbi:AAA family ATPase [bacterium]|nr:AAA family ATPase [bacterium]|tara:strand:- start:34983 stop:36692 length:1710 start_codon:yes stop_codon:yes gene_type:complete
MTQEEALLVLKTGASVFLTGEPGSGKTHAVNRYVAYLRDCGIEPAITASTGIAATHIGGFTIHSWSGIGVRSNLTKYDIDRIGQNRNIVRRVSNARVLIIDEVSMLSAQTLSMIDAVCREVRRSREPFGELQVILVGDFFQLPPVFRKNKDEEQRQTSLIAKDTFRNEFAYQSDTWDALNPITCYLSEQHRQEDTVFLEFLSAVRAQRIQESHKELLRTRYAKTPKDDITQLYSHNADVDVINDVKLDKLSEQSKVFEMTARGPEKLIAALKRGCLSPETLTLKIGARVMFTKNDITRRQYVNGTLGAVTGFSKNNGYPIVKTHTGKTIFTEPNEWLIEDGGRVLARIGQIPLRLAWAMTVHKSQGMSLDAAHMDLSQTFEYGQGYVALSRVRTLAGLSLAGLNTRALEVHPEVCTKDTEFREQSKDAQQRFTEFDTKELATLHTNFIRACGGKPGSGRIKNVPKKTESTYDATCALLKNKKSFAEIAEERDMVLSTIIGHVEKLATEKKINPDHDLAHIKRPKQFEEMKKALEAVHQKEGKMLLTPARTLLNNSCDYEELRLARLFLR